MRFTEDSRGLAILSKEPDAFLTIFYFDKSETIIVGRVSNGNQTGLTADVIACNLSDTGLVAVAGMTNEILHFYTDNTNGLFQGDLHSNYCHAKIKALVLLEQ